MSDRKKGVGILSLMLGLPVVVILASTMLYFMAERGDIDLGTVNRGELISPPLAFADQKPQMISGGDYLFDQADSKWVFLVVGGADCTGSCERMLYLTRQTHTALGKKGPRIERTYLSLDGKLSPALSEFLAAEHSSMKQVSMSREAFYGLFKGRDIDVASAAQFFVIDPRGWLMMRYPVSDLSDAAISDKGKEIIKDMKRLLR